MCKITIMLLDMHRLVCCNLAKCLNPPNCPSKALAKFSHSAAFDGADSSRIQSSKDQVKCSITRVVVSGLQLLACSYVRTCIYVHVCTYIYMYMYVHMYICTCILGPISVKLTSL